MHRTRLADGLCDTFGFIDARGRRRRSSCLKALRVLEKRGHFTLPTAQTKTGPWRPRRLERPVPVPEAMPGRADAVESLELVLVETEAQMRQWNELMLEEHPRGAGPFVGRQLRYLIASGHGVLGGLVFTSAARHLRDRDRWIGWDCEMRRAQLGRVVNLARLLIRPSVRCANLASHVLSRALKQMPKDFEARYGYFPYLVETFVDTSEHAGTCFQAANWMCIGSTAGRGRQDRARAGAETVKDIYVYELQKGFRRQLALPPEAGLGPLPLEVPLRSDRWAEEEFGGAPLGDARWSKRLVRSAMIQAEDPMRAFSGVVDADWAAIKGYYRFIDQPDDSAATMENILLPHRKRTLRRMQAQETVLCIQDGTDLNFNALSTCEGLGTIGKNQTGAKSRGLHLHSTLAVTGEGLPLGVLRTQCWAPASRGEDDTRPAHQIPIEEKDSYAWLLGLRDCREAAAQMPHTRLISVMDREADIFELFDEWRQDPSVDLLVRAQYNRRTTDMAITDRRKTGTAATKLFDRARASAVRARLKICVGRQSARPKKNKQKERPARKERTAHCVLRYERVELCPPPYHRDKAPISLWIIHLAEENAPRGATPIEWFLLTTRAITSVDEAEQCLAWYCLRWRIEDWHRVLKSGCKAEGLQHKTAERIKRAVAIRTVIAWRIMLMTLLGREVPNLPAEVLFSELEIRVLTAFASTRRDLKVPQRLSEAVLIVAKLGGYIGRKNDGPPGHQRMWYGYIKLQGMCDGFVLAHKHMAAASQQTRGSPD